MRKDTGARKKDIDNQCRVCEKERKFGGYKEHLKSQHPEHYKKDPKDLSTLAEVKASSRKIQVQPYQ